MDNSRCNVREIALRLMLSAELEGRYVNLLLNTAEVKALPSEKRAFLTALLYTATERRLAYDYAICALSGRGIDKISADVKNVLRIGLCQIYDMKNIPDHAAVNETVALVRQKSARSFVNALLREAIRRGEPPLPERDKNPHRYLSVKYSVPIALVKHYASLVGENTEALLISLTKKAPLSLTVNTRRTDRASVLASLKEYGAYPTELSPRGVLIDAPVVPKALAGFAEGDFFVQDESSRLAVEALALKGDERVIDVCAAPGGKSFLAAILTSGEVFSFELHESKLSLISEGAERLSLDNITVAKRDATQPCGQLLGTADALICDVPCSGLGVIHKKPDLRYKDLAAISELPELQYEILTKSSAYLKVGGRLVYSTCTLNPRENEDVTDRFVREHTDFEYEKISLGKIEHKSGKLTLYPHIDNTDGFYISLIRKVR